MSAQFQYDKGKYCAEVSFTTDDGLIGVRGLYNFGQDFDDSYEDMQKEGRRRRRELGLEVEEKEEVTLLNNLDSASIELEQESAQDAASLKLKSSNDLVKERVGYLGEETAEEESMSSERIRGYWSAGAEVYYSATEKLGGCKATLYFIKIHV